MNKDECLKLIMQYFNVESCIKHLKNPDLELKSHIFFYRDTFRDINELRILRISSKNTLDNIVFDIYYVSQEFDGLFNGCFRIKPESEMAERLFQNLSKVTTDLGHYFYYIYKNSELLKIYLISGNLDNALQQSKDIDHKDLFQQIRKETYLQISQHSTKELKKLFLRRELLEKYIGNFINMNRKCSERVKMFLINILSHEYSGHICLVKDTAGINNYVHVTTKQVIFNQKPEIPLYGLLDYSVKNHSVLFVKLEFDFEGGGFIGKVIS